MRHRLATVLACVCMLVGLPGNLANGATLTERGQVTSVFDLPTTSREAASLGRDVDRDGHRDNQLGAVFATFAGQGFDMSAAQDAAIAAGEVVILHSLRTSSLANAKRATWQVLQGVPTAEPDLDGGGTFEVDPALPRSSRLDARVKSHVVRTQPGRVPVQLDLGATSVSPMVLELTKAVVTATCTRSGCTKGKISGAVTTEDVDAVLLPYLATMYTEIIQRDCPGPEPSSCTSGSQGKAFQDLFDADDDMVVTVEELQENELMDSLLAPDLDLVKASGKPGQDGVMDAISFGVGFATSRAKLVRP